MVRVLVVDDHPFVRSSLVAVLGAAAGIEVVGACSDGGEVPLVAADTRPDVVLMDMRMPGVNGAQATSALGKSHPDTRVLMLSLLTSQQALEDASRAGAVGYLYKGGDPAALLDAVRAVAGGESAWPVHAGTRLSGSTGSLPGY